MKSRIYFVLSFFSACVIILSWLILNQLIEYRKDLKKELFESQVDSFMYSLKERLFGNQIILEDIVGFFSGSEFVSFTEWNEYFSHVDIQEKFPGIIWIAFIKKISSSEKITFQNEISRSLHRDVKIWPEGARSVYYPIQYVNSQLYEGLVGYDFASNETQGALLSNAPIGTISTMDSLKINSSKKNRSEKILYIPVMKGSDRVGWVVATLNFATIIKDIGKNLLAPTLSLEVYTGDASDGKNILFQKNQISAKPFELSTEKSIDFAGTQLTFVFNGTFPSVKNITAYPFFLVLFLLLVSILFGLFLYFRYLKKSGYTTSEEKLQENILSSLTYAIIAVNMEGIIIFFNPAAEKLLGYSASEMVGKKSPISFHDPDEMAQRAKELSVILNREVKSGLEVFIAFAEKHMVEDRMWTYITKDNHRVSVRLSIATLNNEKGELIGYVGVSATTAQLRV